MRNTLILKSEELMLIKAEYPYELKELASKLCNISIMERRFIRMVNKYIPIHTETPKDHYLEYCLFDYNITDVSKEFIQDSSQFDEEFKDKVINYIHYVMDLDVILDRLQQIGRYRLNDFEMLYLERASQGYVKI
jgi:hypothetical protein